MKFNNIYCIILSIAVIVLASCKDEDQKSETMEPKLKEENITYSGDGITMNGFIAYDENKKGARPAVLVVHEWWGLNDYPKRRARELAKLGYIAMALDMYGGGKQADTPDSAGKLATPFYMDTQMAKRRFDAALAKLKTYEQTDSSKIAAIGYCFGGSMVLNMAKLGENLGGVVSFHGILSDDPPADKSLLKAKILVCHGEDDQFTPQNDIDLFKHQLDSIKADYTFVVYAGATHAFTNPAATENGKKFNIPIAYNAAADTASWNEMKSFFEKIFN